MDMWTWGADFTPQQRVALMVSGVSCIVGATSAIAKAIRLSIKTVRPNKVQYIAELAEVVGALTVVTFGIVGLIYVVFGIDIDLFGAFIVFMVYVLVAIGSCFLHVHTKNKMQIAAERFKEKPSAGTQG